MNRNFLISIFTSVCFVVLFSGSIAAQGFLQLYGPVPGQPYKFGQVVQLTSGNYACVVTNPVPQVVIYNHAGQAVDTVQDFAYSAPTLPQLNSIAPTNDGGFALTLRGADYLNAEFSICRIGANGTPLWTKKYPNAPSNFTTSDPKKIIQTPDNGLVMAGRSYNPFADYYNGYLLKVDAQGDSLWSYSFSTYTAQLHVFFNDVINTSDGGLLIAGTMALDTANLTYNSLVIKLDGNGNEEWFRVYTGGSPVLYKIAETQTGYTIIGGTTLTNGNSAGFLMSISSIGDSLSSRFHYFGGSFTDIAVAPDNGFLVTGYTGQTAFPGVGSDTLILIKFNSQFNEQWVQRYSQFLQPSSAATSIIKEGGGEFVLAGYSGENGLLIKTDSLGKIPTSVVKGQLLYDMNSNCINDAGEVGLYGHLIKVVGGNSHPYYSYTDTNGYYKIAIPDTGAATVSWNSQNGYWGQASCQPSNIAVQLIDGDTVNMDVFATPLILCSKLSVTASSGGLRRCFGNNLYVITYCNNGTIPADSSYVLLEFDPYLTVDSASIPLGLPVGPNQFRFDLGTLAVGDCGTFNVWVTVDCDSTILGQAHCLSAHMYPDSICLPPNTSWDNASLQINTQCLPNDSILFQLINQGSGNMVSPLNYIIVEDNVMYKQAKFQLLAGQSLTEKVLANGSTFTMVVPQSPGHPGNSNPINIVEGCGTNNQGGYSTGFTVQFPQDDQDEFVDIICLENSGSFDPNDKRPEPKGLGVEGFINATQPLDYTIRFQNTGTDTAFTVVIRDTLPSYLDITTLRLKGATHAYTFQILNNNILVWTFNNILLPDSNVNEPMSHGFVSFSINQVDGNAVGTKIKNRAGIYFDFNDPVMTDYTLNTIVEDYLDKITVSISEVENNGNSLQLYPNPNNGQFFIKLQQPIEGDITFTVYDLAGKQLLNNTYRGDGPHTVAVEGLETGMYLYKLTAQSGMISTGKVLINR